MPEVQAAALDCPVPFSQYERVVLAHGSSGRVAQRLIRDLFRARFDNLWLDEEHDGAVVEASGKWALTTDAFTVKPLFFPGGDIGKLAVVGTVNDLAMCGASARYLTVSFVLEEGLELSVLSRIVDSMAHAANACEVAIVAGDTKVVERGKAEGVYITTSGAGPVQSAQALGPRAMRPGDAILVSGPVGDHGLALLNARDRVAPDLRLDSDCAAVNQSVQQLIAAGIDLHCLRDPTRGGLAGTLNELAEKSALCVRLEEASIPVRTEVADLSELLGLDPLYAPCEGRFIALLAEHDAQPALELLRAHDPLATRIGTLHKDPAGTVLLDTPLGSRVLDMLAGDQFPRIC